MVEFLSKEEIDTLLEIANPESIELAFTEPTKLVSTLGVAGQIVAEELPPINPKQIELGEAFATKLLGEHYEIPNYKLAEIQSQILDWNIIRNNIDYDEASELGMYASEVQEEIDAEGVIDGIIDSWCDRFVLMVGALAKSGYANKGLSEAMLVNYEEFKKIPKRVKSLGYCFRRAMKECLAEINSREQDLVQAKEWAENGASGKWEKWQDQNPDTLYKADYSKALICKDCDGKEG